jgi:Na+/proline symporter
MLHGKCPLRKSLLPEVKGDSGFGRVFVNWLLGIVLVYAFLFGIGQVIFHEYYSGMLIISIGIVAGVGINFRKGVKDE